MNILIYLVIINRAIALKQGVDTEWDIMRNTSMKWGTSEPTMETDGTQSNEPLLSGKKFDIVHVSGSIACGLSVIASTATIVYLFINEEKNIYRRKVKYQIYNYIKKMTKIVPQG